VRKATYKVILSLPKWCDFTGELEKANFLTTSSFNITHTKKIGFFYTDYFLTVKGTIEEVIGFKRLIEEWGCGQASNPKGVITYDG